MLGERAGHGRARRGRRDLHTTEGGARPDNVAAAGKRGAERLTGGAWYLSASRAGGARSYVACLRATVATQGKRLIALSETERHWMTEEEVLALRRAKHETGRLGLGFMDVTDDPFPARTTFRRAFPTEPSQQAIVQPLLEAMEPESVMEFLTPFTTFNNRVRRVRFATATLHESVARVDVERPLLASMVRLVLHLGHWRGGPHLAARLHGGDRPERRP